MTAAHTASHCYFQIGAFVDPVNHYDIARVVRSVCSVLKQRGWTVLTSRSPRSLSRYVRAFKGNRRLIIRVSDHRAKKHQRLDYDFNPRDYSERRFARSISRKKTRFRSRKR